MDSSEVTEVCRLCPSSGSGEDLLYVFDERLSVKNNMKEVILVTTGIEIQESDIISKKICHRCCTKTLQMFLFRQDALTQDRALKEKCNRLLEDKGLRLPNTCITIKRERLESCSPTKRPKVEPEVDQSEINDQKPQFLLHSTVAEIYKTYPSIKLPKKSLNKHWAPIVSFTMDEVERYFKKRKLDMNRFIYKSSPKKVRYNAVAKKRTSAPVKQKVVSPIKISKMVLENQEESESASNINYVCTPLRKEGKWKKKISDPGTSKTAVVISSSPNKPVEIQNPTVHSKSPSNENVSKIVPVEQVLPQKLQPAPVLPPASTLTEFNSQNDENDYIRVNKPEFIESLGLTPTVTATKSQTLHICNLCGSVHNNAFKLKTHTRKHMVCQFCKLRFKSLESKQDHVDNSCQVKEILNSSGPFVDLEKVHLNVDVRRKYKNAFGSFESIPGLEEPNVINQTVMELAPAPHTCVSDIVSISDNEDNAAKSNSPPNAIPPNSTVVTEKVTSVSIIRPDVQIRNNTVLDNLEGDMSDKELIKTLHGVLKLRRTRTQDKILQTDLPITKDIKINNAEGYCEFKHLKNQLSFYRIPVSITDGPFSVAYTYKNSTNTNKFKALWSDLPVHEIYQETGFNQSTNNNSPQIPALNKICTGRTHVQSKNVSSTTNCPVLPIAQHTLPTSLPVNNVQVDLPLKQNFARRTSLPANNNNNTDKHITTKPKAYANSALKSGSASASKRNMPSTLVRNSTISRKSLPVNLLNTEKSVTTNIPPKPLTNKNIKNNPGNKQLRANSPMVTLKQASTPSLQETSKVRVKNVWELQ